MRMLSGKDLKEILQIAAADQYGNYVEYSDIRDYEKANLASAKSLRFEKMAKEICPLKTYSIEEWKPGELGRKESGDSRDYGESPDQVL